QGGGVQQRADVVQRVAQALVPLPADQRAAVVGGVQAEITRIVVDLPAPLGPTNPVTCPGWTVNVIPSSATVGPKCLRRPLTSIVASMPATVGKRRRCCRRAGEPSSPSLARGTPAPAHPP